MTSFFLQNFQSKSLDEKEIKCVTLCTEKYLKATQRMGFRFAEQQTNKAQLLQDQGKKRVQGDCRFVDGRIWGTKTLNA